MAAAIVSALMLALDNARLALDKARLALSDHEKAARKAAHAEWVAAGGCPTCNGDGGWSTSYHDGDSVWDTCPRVRTGECSKGKLAPFAYNGLDADDTVGMALADAVYVAKNEVARLEKATEVGKAKLVRVFKGRKVPIGTTGRVFWIGQSQWGERVGIKDSEGETHWTATSNVEVLEDVPADTRPAAERPERGRKIRHGATVGVVFWYGRGRDGVSFRVGFNALEGRKASKEATWADASEVEVLAA